MLKSSENSDLDPVRKDGTMHHTYFSVWNNFEHHLYIQMKLFANCCYSMHDISPQWGKKTYNYVCHFLCEFSLLSPIVNWDTIHQSNLFNYYLEIACSAPISVESIKHPLDARILVYRALIPHQHCLQASSILIRTLLCNVFRLCSILHVFKSWSVTQWQLCIPTVHGCEAMCSRYSTLDWVPRRSWLHVLMVISSLLMLWHDSRYKEAKELVCELYIIKECLCIYMMLLCFPYVQQLFAPLALMIYIFRIYKIYWYVSLVNTYGVGYRSYIYIGAQYLGMW